MGEWLKVGPAGNRAYLATPERGSGPGVLVLHAWWGLTSVFTDVCDQLATEGYVALAPGLYTSGETTAAIDRAEELASAQFAASHEADAVVSAAVDLLRASPAVTSTQLGVIGYSMGANWALDLSQTRPDDIKAVVAVYGTDGGDYSTAKAAYLGHFAEHDDFEPLDAVRALEERIRTAGRDVTFHIYPDTGHWFVEPNRPDVYNPAAAELVWERTLAFFSTHLG